MSEQSREGIASNGVVSVTLNLSNVETETVSGAPNIGQARPTDTINLFRL